MGLILPAGPPGRIGGIPKPTVRSAASPRESHVEVVLPRGAVHALLPLRRDRGLADRGREPLGEVVGVVAPEPPDVALDGGLVGPLDAARVEVAHDALADDRDAVRG